MAGRLSPPEQCVILVGGLGTRLGALTGGMPKPMAEVGGRPFLAYLMWHARRFGLRRILLLAGHRAERLVERTDALLDASGARPGELEIDVLVEPEPLGTAGALRFAADRLDESFLLLNGDSLFDFNWLDLVTLAEPGVQAIMALRFEPDASRFGVVGVQGEEVTAFVERGDATGGLINGGVYLLSRQVALACPAKGSFEREVLPELAAQGFVRGRRQDGFFLDIGVPDSLAQAQTAVPASRRRGAVFFDRDGVINVDHGYVHRAADFEWVQGAAAAVKEVNDRGLFAFLVTNQAGVARGYYPESDILDLHAHVQTTLRASGAHFDDIRYCPHHPEGTVAGYDHACDWRKPGPGMILDLARKWRVDLSASFVVGDKPSDLEAGRAAGMPSLLFEDGDLQAFVAAALA